MSLQQSNTRRAAAPVTIDLTASERPRPPAPDKRRPPAPVSDTGPEHGPRPAAPESRADFDILSIPPAPYDRWDRLYRNIVLALFAVAMVAGFWFRH